MIMRILGVDPGILHLGAVILEKNGDHWKILKPFYINTSSELTLSKRLHLIFKSMEALFKQYKPDFLAIEEPIPKANPQNTAKLSQVFALILILAEEEHIPLKTYAPTMWKGLLCGDGRIKKEDLLKCLTKLLGDEIDVKITNEHILDALGVAITCALEERVL